jgi:hypothetical protein
MGMRAPSLASANTLSSSDSGTLIGVEKNPSFGGEMLDKHSLV